MELKLIQILLNKEIYNKYNSYINRKEFKENNRELSFILGVVDELHQSVEGNISVDELEVVFWTSLPEASHDVYDGLFTDLRAMDISDAVAEHVFAAMARKKAAIALSEASFELSQG